MLPVLINRVQNWPETGDWMDREFGRMLRRFWNEGNGTQAAPMAMYPVNIWEDDDSVHVEAELPGFKKDEVELTLGQGMLTITAERKQQPEAEKSENALLHERRFMRYQRSFTLPSSVDDKDVNAHLEDGVLHITLPKRADVKPRRIQVS